MEYSIIKINDIHYILEKLHIMYSYNILREKCVELTQRMHSVNINSNEMIYTKSTIIGLVMPFTVFTLL